jgi:predicted small secreted protein
VKIDIRSLITLVAATVLTGCATSRGVLDISQSAVDNPDSGVAIAIVRVSDRRSFELNPRQADIPSLKNGEIRNESITSRAIARKRNGFGKAMGDILLPEDQTVSELVKQTVADAFRSSGYRVIDSNDLGFAQAVPVEVDINEFWAWMQPGFWQLTLHHRASISLSSPLNALMGSDDVRSDVTEGFQTASGGNWMKTIDAGLAQLRSNIASAVTAGDSQPKSGHR